MILSATLSKPCKNITDFFDKEFVKIKVKRLAASATNDVYFLEMFTKTQVFHKRLSENDAQKFIDDNVGKSFFSCFIRTQNSEIQLTADKKGNVKKVEREIDETLKNIVLTGQNRQKNHILKEGNPVPFLVRLGIMTASGKVIAAKRDKFRQINRFLEIFSDVLPDVIKNRSETGDNSPLRIIDFGSGKSYLTFAIQYFLSEIKKIDSKILGLDLKKDVVEFCQKLTKELNLSNLEFAVGDISFYDGEKNPDVVVTLHACDTATDFALDYSVRKNACAILCVPCCQHELNAQLLHSKNLPSSPLEPLLRYGLIKEKFASLATDAIRAETLEKLGYKVQILEFIEESNTPKNLLIRATKQAKKDQILLNGTNSLLTALNATQYFSSLWQ